MSMSFPPGPALVPRLLIAVTVNVSGFACKPDLESFLNLRRQCTGRADEVGISARLRSRRQQFSVLEYAIAASSQTNIRCKCAIAAGGWVRFWGCRLSRPRLGLHLMPKLFSDPEAIAEDIIRDVGTNLVVGLPLGLGKANHIVNALYARAAADRAISLTFFSALTLEKPKPLNLLERRFIAPVIERLFGGYPDLAYADALHAGALPPNIRAIECFFLAGRRPQLPFAQQTSIAANYTHASSYLLARGLNVVTQLVAKRVVDGVARYSLSCNTDTTLDILRARAQGAASFKLIGQANSELPFMPGLGG